MEEAPLMLINSVICYYCRGSGEAMATTDLLHFWGLPAEKCSSIDFFPILPICSLSGVSYAYPEILETLLLKVGSAATE